MDRVFLMAEVREERGKTAAKRLRKQGYVTVNLYGKDKENVDLKISASELERRYGKDITPSTIIQLQIGKDAAGGTHTVILKELQKDQFKQQFIHIDFQEVSADEKVKVEVPIHLIGQAVGTSYGGIIQQPLRTVEVEARTINVPAQIDVDISNLEVGEQITVGQLPVSPGMVYLNDPEEVVVGVVLGARTEEETPLAEPAGV